MSDLYLMFGYLLFIRTWDTLGWKRTAAGFAGFGALASVYIWLFGRGGWAWLLKP